MKPFFVRPGGMRMKNSLYLDDGPAYFRYVGLSVTGRAVNETR